VQAVTIPGRALRDSDPGCCDSIDAIEDITALSTNGVLDCAENWWHWVYAVPLKARLESPFSVEPHQRSISLQLG
jgi:hypothetical protein